MGRKKSDLTDEERRLQQIQRSREYYAKNKSKHTVTVRKYQIKNNAKLKLEVFTHYSIKISNSKTPICACCGYSDIRFLSLDHINGREFVDDKERKLVSGALWKYVKSKGFRDGYQILCHNCNIAKGKGKYCPHQLDKINYDRN